MIRMDMESFGNEVKRLRLEAGLTQKLAASKAGIGYTTWQDIERGKGNPEVGSLKAVADLFKIGLSIFMNSQDECRLLDLFRVATDRHKILILGYSQGLVDDYQPQTTSGGAKRSN